MTCSAFVTQLNDEEKVRWHILLASGVSEMNAQAQLRPGAPYIAVLAADYPSSSGGPWKALQQALGIRHMPADGRLACGARIARGIGIDAPISGALVVASSCTSIDELHHLAIWMAYRRGCRRFMVILTGAEQLADDELAEYAAKDAARLIRCWLGDTEIEVGHFWGSCRAPKNASAADLPFVQNVWKQIEAWHQSPMHQGHATPSTLSTGALRKWINVLEQLTTPTLGFKDTTHSYTVKAGTAEACSRHNARFAKTFVLDYSQLGHGLPFHETWVLRCCTELRGCGMTWSSEGCFHIDRYPRAQHKLRGTAGFLLPSFESMQTGERHTEIEAILNHIGSYQYTTGRGAEAAYWAVQDILGMTQAPGYWSLGGTIIAPTEDLSVRCQTCHQWMPLAFESRTWADASMYLWVCQHCPDEAFVNFQR